MVIGLIYRIDYIGENTILKNCKYAGSTTRLDKWSGYFGSPSTKGCIKCKMWRQLSKSRPEDFKKIIITEVFQGESITQKEAEYLKSVSNDIIADKEWLNASIPREGAFPQYSFTKEKMQERETKRKYTTYKKTGFEYGFLDIEKRRNTCNERYGVSNYNQLDTQKLKNSLHKKKFFSQMSKEDKKLHGLKSLTNRNELNVKIGVEKCKKTKSTYTAEKKNQIEVSRYKKWCEKYYNRSNEEKAQTSKKCTIASTMLRKQYYITIHNHTSNTCESKFLSEWLKCGYARDGIMDRIKNNSKEQLFSRTTKQIISIVKVVKLSPATI